MDEDFAAVTLELLSPFQPMVVHKFSWPLERNLPVICAKEDRDLWHHRGHEIVRTIEWICKEDDEIRLAMESTDFQVMDEKDFDSYKKMRLICDTYNLAVRSSEAYCRVDLNRLRPIAPETRGLLKHILQQCYSRSVLDPKDLNKFEKYERSDGKIDYGEVSFETICDIVDRIGVGTVFQENRFVDLGSGVGQVVLQVAGLTTFEEVVEIEIGDIRADYAREMESHFRDWMGFFGRSFAAFRLIKDDFLKAIHRPLLQKNTLLFLNNLTFPITVNQHLEKIFLDLDDGSIIVSSSNFLKRGNGPHVLQLDNGACIIRLQHIVIGTVSWTRHDLPKFYIQTKGK